MVVAIGLALAMVVVVMARRTADTSISRVTSDYDYKLVVDDSRSVFEMMSWDRCGTGCWTLTKERDMPASIAHMLIAQQTRDCLLKDNDKKLAEFATDVLAKHSHYMELGSLGPDLPYFGLKSLFNPHKPMKVDQWSYQLHSRSPNVFPLQMIELLWRENDPRVEEWKESDKCKLAFICGYLTHVAADQVIHPLVNFIAGPYYHSHEARVEHRTCEVHQDVYLLAKQKHNGTLTIEQFRAEQFHCDCDIRCDGDSSNDSLQDLRYDEFLYFLQKAFVEAHAVMPSVGFLKRRIVFLRWALRLCKRQSWYKSAYTNLFDDKGSLRENEKQYEKYVSLQKGHNNKMFMRLSEGKKHYDEFVDEAVKLASIYIQAAHQLYDAPRLDDDLRENFRDVVVNADLGFPLELHVLQTATDSLPKLAKCVEGIRSRWHLNDERN